jgi:hypothetical protein
MQVFTSEKQNITVNRMVYTSGSTRGIYAFTGTTMGCLVPLSEESSSLNGIQYGFGFKLIMEVNQDVREGDKVTVDGTIYNVRGTALHNRGFNAQYLRCILMRAEKQ